MVISSELAAAFKEDIRRLRNKFMKLRSFKFSDFKHIWNESHFYLLNSGINTYRECLEVTEFKLRCSKELWLKEKALPEAAFQFYFMAAVFYIQPVIGAVKIRLDQDDIDSAAQFLQLVRTEKCLEAELLFAKMLICDYAFHFCVSVKETFQVELDVPRAKPGKYLRPLGSFVILAEQLRDKLVDYSERKKCVNVQVPSIGKETELVHDANKLVSILKLRPGLKLIKTEEGDDYVKEEHLSGDEKPEVGRRKYKSRATKKKSSNSKSYKKVSACVKNEDIGNRRRRLRYKAFQSAKPANSRKKKTDIKVVKKIKKEEEKEETGADSVNLEDPEVQVLSTKEI